MKIGLLISEIEHRPDLLEFAEELNEVHDVTVLRGLPEGDRVCGPSGTLSAARRVPVSGPWNRNLKRIYSFFGQRPRDRSFLKASQLRRLDRSEIRGWRSKLRRSSIWLRSVAPELISYDVLLGWIRVDESTSNFVRDLDALFVTSDVASDELLAAAIRLRVPTVLYVYSWDHPAKFSRLPRAGVTVAVWSRGIAQDLHHLHGIDEKSVRFLPASQYEELRRFARERRKVGSPARQILYAASFGYPTLALQEVEMVRQLAGSLASSHPEITMVFRGYPHLAGTEVYQPLSDLSNVVMDSTLGAVDRGLGAEAMRRKAEVMEDSLAVVHCGTTVGIEAAILDVPVIYVNFETKLEARTRPKSSRAAEAWAQYHLQRYYFEVGSPNVVESLDDFRVAIGRLVRGDVEMLAYGRSVRRVAGDSDESLARAFESLLEELDNSRASASPRAGLS